jgi:hypothetical protein
VAESLTLTNAEVIPAVSTGFYRVVYLAMHWEQSLIVIHLRGEHGELKEFRYGGSTAPSAEKTKALNLMIALNKANLTVKSLQRRVLEQLAADGLLAGSVTGTPD